MSYMKLTEELARRHLGYDGRYYVGPDITDLEPMVEGASNEVLKRMIYELGRAKLSQATEPVTDLHYFSTAVSKYKVYATVEGRVHSYTETGSYNPDIALGCSYDLFMAAKKRVWLVNIYKDLSCSSVCGSEDDAKREKTSAVVATIKVEWEDETV